jgi:hypothetical protein
LVKREGRKGTKEGLEGRRSEGKTRRDELLESPFGSGVQSPGDYVERFDRRVRDVEAGEGEGAEGEEPAECSVGYVGRTELEGTKVGERDVTPGNRGIFEEGRLEYRR